MAVQAFLDDSGSKGSTRSFLLAGFIAQEEAWAGFSEEWANCLAESPSIAYFKLHDAMHGSGEFARIKSPAREQKVQKLAGIVLSHVETSIHCSVDLTAFAATLANNNPPYNHPHYIAYQYAIGAACEDIYARGYTGEAFEAIFDETRIFEPRIRQWYASIQAMIHIALSPDSKILPDDILFASDRDCLPLQAGDMAAGFFRHVLDNHLGSRELITNPILELLEREWADLPLSPHSASLGERRTQRLWEAQERLGSKLSKLGASAAADITGDSRRLLQLMADELSKTE